MLYMHGYLLRLSMRLSARNRGHGMQYDTMDSMFFRMIREFHICAAERDAQTGVREFVIRLRFEIACSGAYG
jgi:hypothetical protein